MKEMQRQSEKEIKKMIYLRSADLKSFTINDELTKFFFSLADHAEENISVMIKLNHVTKFKADKNKVR